MALVKYNNNSISSVTALGSLPAGGLNLITTNTITSGVSSSSFTSNIDSTYDTYLFKFINMHPASDQKNFEVKRLKLDKGSIVFFPSNFMYPHGIEPITKGTRYSIVSWLQ